MDITQVAIIGIIGMILSIIIKKEIPSISVLISVAVGIIIFVGILPKIEAVIQILYEMISKSNIDIKYVDIVLKIIGIAYISQFASQICSDAGESSIASKIEFAGKVIIMVISAPVLMSLIEMIMNLMSWFFILWSW